MILKHQNWDPVQKIAKIRAIQGRGSAAKKVSYSPVRMKFNSNNVSFNFWRYSKTIKKCNTPLKSPIKWLARTQHFEKNFNFCRFLGPFLENYCFRKMGMAGIKCEPCPPILYPFFTKLNEKALQKVSFKNLYWFQSWKTPLFQKWP